MLTLTTDRASYCDRVSRRSFLQVGALAGLGVSLPMALAAKKASAASGGSGVNCILIWTRGGTSHHDTFDPKPDAPVSVKGEFGVIDTALPGIKFTEICPTFAKEAKRFSLLRGWNPKNGSHGTADQYVMSGRPVSQAVRYPTYGSVVSHHLGFKIGAAALRSARHRDRSAVRRRQPGHPGPGARPVRDRRRSQRGRISSSATSRRPPASRPSGSTSAKRCWPASTSSSGSGDIQPAAFDALDENYKTALNMITAPETQGRVRPRRRKTTSSARPTARTSSARAA